MYVDDLIPPPLGDVIIKDGKPTIEFFTWITVVTSAVNALPPLTGTVAPENNITASVGRWYVRTSSGVIYFKQSGDGDTGWLATT